jgi:hypothetical protein
VPGKGWLSHGLGYVDVHDRLSALLDEAADVDEHGTPTCCTSPGSTKCWSPFAPRPKSCVAAFALARTPGAAASLGAIVDRYLSDIKPARRPRTFKEIERHLTRDWKLLHHRPITQLSRAEIADRLDKLKAESGPVARVEHHRADVHGGGGGRDDQGGHGERRLRATGIVGPRELCAGAEADALLEAVARLGWHLVWEGGR